VADFVKVKFLRHFPPFMPGDHATFAVEKAKSLESKGHVVVSGTAPAPKLETGRANFDPAASPIEDVRAYIAGHGAEVPAKAPDAKLRELAATILAGAQA
jgi:hypothetical protein